MRLFIAINLDGAVRQQIYHSVEPLRVLLPHARWVEPELLHLTVKFLGNCDADLARSVGNSLERVAGVYRSIPLSIADVGAFPNLRRPGIVWMGVTADPKLELLHHDVEKECASLGIPLEGRPFKPHITLARVREGPRVSATQLAGVCSAIRYRGHVDATSLDLMVSEHVNRRHVYRTLLEAALTKE